jgi:hypothetical protein
MFIRNTAYRRMAWRGKASGKDVFLAPDGTEWRVDARPSLDEAQRAAYDAWQREKKDG